MAVMAGGMLVVVAALAWWLLRVADQALVRISPESSEKADRART